MPLILGTNSIKDTGYDVANSLRFNPGSSDTLSKTLSTPTNNKKFTFSFWIKKCENGREQHIVNGGASSSQFYFNSSDQLYFYDQTAGGTYKTTQVFRDVSAWYHIVVAEDTTQGTASSRIRIYVNGSEITDFAIETDPTQNNSSAYNTAATHTIGTYAVSPSGYYLNGYLAEFVFIDGQQLDPTSFGEFDEDSPTIWKPKDVSGLTFGNNGFHLDFENASSLGADVSGNSNNFNVNNLTSVDQSTDTCTNNFATMNSLDNYFASSTFSEGNLKIVTTGGNITYNTSTIGFSSGKWYMETKLSGSAGYTIGVVRGVATANDNSNKLGNRSDGWSYDDGGDVEHNGGSLTGSFASYSSGNIIGIYADLDNNKLYFSKDGSLQNSGTGLTLTAGTYFFALGDNNSSNSSTYEVNFGSPSFSISSGNTDGEFGNFEYSTTITGDGASKTFKALCTKNLAEFG